jgi:hypothetical protein
MPNEENRARLADVAIDKGIVHHDVSAGTQMPPSIRGNAPISREPTIPNGVVTSPNISPGVKSDLGKLTPELARGIRDVAARK